MKAVCHPLLRNVREALVAPSFGFAGAGFRGASVPKGAGPGVPHARDMGVYRSMCSVTLRSNPSGTITAEGSDAMGKFGGSAPDVELWKRAKK